MKNGDLPRHCVFRTRSHIERELCVDGQLLCEAGCKVSGSRWTVDGKHLATVVGLAPVGKTTKVWVVRQGEQGISSYSLNVWLRTATVQRPLNVVPLADLPGFVRWLDPTFAEAPPPMPVAVASAVLPDRTSAGPVFLLPDMHLCVSPPTPQHPLLLAPLRNVPGVIAHMHVNGSDTDGYDLFLSVIAEPLELPGKRCLSVRSDATSLLAVTADGGPPGAIVVTGDGSSVSVATTLCGGPRADELRQLHQLGIPIVAVGSVCEALGAIVVAKTLASVHTEEPLWVSSTSGASAVHNALAEGYLSRESELCCVQGVGIIADTLVVAGRRSIALGRPVGARSCLSQLSTDGRHGGVIVRSIGIPAEHGAVYFGNDASIAPVCCSSNKPLLVCTVVEVGAGSQARLDVVPLIDQSLAFPDYDACDLMHWGSPESLSVSLPEVRLRAAAQVHRDRMEAGNAMRQRRVDDPSTIVANFLFVGSVDAAGRFDKLGFTHVVNCAVDVPSYPAYFLTSTVRVLQLDLEDSIDEDMERFTQQLQRAASFIAEASAVANARVLVHCRAGVSRATAVAIYYLMERSRLSLTEAMRRVKESRPTARPNEAYMTILRLLDKWGDPRRDAQRSASSSAVRPGETMARRSPSGATTTAARATRAVGTSTSAAGTLSTSVRGGSGGGAPSKFVKRPSPPKVEEEEDDVDA